MFHENVGTPIRSSTKYFVIFGLLLLVVGMGYSAYMYHKASAPSVPERATRSGPSEPAIPLASMPQSEWPKLVIPAPGRSKLIPVPQGMHVKMVGGNKFRLYTVYQDGRECAFGDSCPISPQKGVYAKNEAEETIIVSYAYVQD
ncbi:MAG: hypothetical protein Q8L30_01460 [bacterium]|nr:hypothetical protein [bacterium]